MNIFKEKSGQNKSIIIFFLCILSVCIILFFKKQPVNHISSFIEPEVQKNKTIENDTGVCGTECQFLIEYNIETGKVTSGTENMRTKKLSSDNLLVELGPDLYFASNPNGQCGAGCTPAAIEFYYINTQTGIVSPVPFEYNYYSANQDKSQKILEKNYHNISFSDDWELNASDYEKQNFFLNNDWSVFSAFHEIAFSPKQKQLEAPFWRRIDFCFSEKRLVYSQCKITDKVLAPTPESFSQNEMSSIETPTPILDIVHSSSTPFDSVIIPDLYEIPGQKNTPSVSIEVSHNKKVYNRGDSVSLTWSVKYAPKESFVSLELTPITPGEDLGIIKEQLSLYGSIDWHIPPITERSQYGGDYRIKGSDIIDGTTYRVKANLYIPTEQICYEGCPPGFGTVITSSESVPFVIGHSISPTPQTLHEQYLSVIQNVSKVLLRFLTELLHIFW